MQSEVANVNGVNTEKHKHKKRDKKERKSLEANGESKHQVPALKLTEVANTPVISNDAENDVYRKSRKEKAKKRKAEELAGDEMNTLVSTCSLPSNSSEASTSAAIMANGIDERSKHMSKKEKKKRKLQEEQNESSQGLLEGPLDEPASISVPLEQVTNGISSTKEPSIKSKKKRKKQPLQGLGEMIDTAEKRETPSLLAATDSVKISHTEIDSFIKENNVSYEPSTSSSSYPPILSFDALPVSPNIKDGLKAFRKPTVVQSASWGVQLSVDEKTRARDCVAIASTG